MEVLKRRVKSPPKKHVQHYISYQVACFGRRVSDGKPGVSGGGFEPSGFLLIDFYHRALNGIKLLHLLSSHAHVRNNDNLLNTWQKLARGYYATCPALRHLTIGVVGRAWLLGS